MNIPQKRNKSIILLSFNDIFKQLLVITIDEFIKRFLHPTNGENIN